MITVKTVYTYIDETAPFSTAEEWDNSGLLIGDMETEVTGIAVCLDVTCEVIERAQSQNCNLIISHHPVIFHPLKQIGSDHIVSRLIAQGMTVICAHTNLDLAPEGPNFYLGRMLALTGVRPAKPFGIVGYLPEEMEPEAFSRFAKEALGCTGGQLVEGIRPVKKVGICSGSGGDLPDEPDFAGIDAMVTGECKYSEAQRAAQLGITLLAAGHYETEQVVIEPLAQKLAAVFGDIPVTAVDSGVIRWL